MQPSEIRRNAREALAGKWGKGICIVFAYIVFIIGLSFLQSLFILNLPVYTLFSIAITIISVPITLGLVISFMKLKRGEQVTAFGFLKYGFSRFGRSWGIAWHTFIRLLIPMFCVILVMVLFSAIITMNATSSLLDAASSASDSYQKAMEQEQALIDGYQSSLSGYSSYDSTQLRTPQTITQSEKTNNNSSFVDSPLFTILFVVLYIAILIYVFSRSLLYVLANNICYDNPELSSKECVVRSAELMKGNRGNYFLLSLSFIGWAILAVFTLYIGYFWLIPYIQVAMVCFYDRLIEKEQSNVIEEL